jgi:hypothetical protein
MAEITIQVPDEIAEALELVGTLTADEVEMRDLIVWNIRTRADALTGWAESAQPDAAEARRLITPLVALAGAYRLVVGDTAEAGAA